VNNKKTALDKEFGRIRSIDFLKGVSICIIILINTAEIWLDSESRYLYALIYVYLDVIGTSLFIFLFSISVVFLWKKRMGITPSKAIRNDILMRGIILIALGIIYNIISTSIFQNKTFPYNVWGWNILTFIGFAQIISYYALKLSRGSRWILGFLIFFASTPLRDLLIIFKYSYPVGTILHFIIISPNPQVTILPYLGLCFFSTIFGERILECLQLEANECNLEAFRSFILFGAIFLAIGIYYGFGPVTSEILDPEDFPMVNLFPLLKGSPYFPFSGIPGIFVRGTAPNLLYGLGVSLIILGITFYFLDTRHIHTSMDRMFNVYGRSALNLVFIHLIGLLIFYHQLNFFLFFIMFFIFIGLLGVLMHLWYKFAKDIGTLKWFISKVGSRHK